MLQVHALPPRELPSVISWIQVISCTNCAATDMNGSISAGPDRLLCVLTQRIVSANVKFQGKEVFSLLFPWTFLINKLSLQSITKLKTITTMIRGMKQFKCDDCGHVFEALDIEWQATAYSTPMSCPKCSSRHTMPKTLFGFVDKGAYRRIWEKTEKK